MGVHMYLLDGLLVDTGQSNMARYALAFLEGKTIHRIVLTHHHEDHSGNAALISARHRAPVLGHPVAVEKMRARAPICPYQHLMWGRSAPCTVIPYPETIQTERFELTPIHTPGHSRDHTVYLEKNRGWLFSGDLFLGEQIKYFRKDEVMIDQINSLKRVMGLDFDTLFCAHRPAWKKGKEKIGKKLLFLEELHGRVEALHQKGMNVRGITQALKSSSDRVERWFTLGNVSFEHMVRSSLNGLRSLE
ncbi:MAG: MBL fold metallo-hydrolase [Desulfobacteraceae bacterium]|nr:MBL fold metallo-hydrolase [Desulfobacteraceae bacterium]